MTSCGLFVLAASQISREENAVVMKMYYNFIGSKIYVKLYIFFFIHLELLSILVL